MAETIEELTARWWAEWWKADYSWAGLARESPMEPGQADKVWPGVWIDANGALTTQNTTAVRTANLQDYWRRGPGSGRETDERDDAVLDQEMLMTGELVRGPTGDQLWHVVHVPTEWPDAVPLPGKGHWNEVQRARLEILIRARLDASQTEDDGSIDRRAQFLGAIFPSKPIPTNPEISLVADFRHCHFLSDIDYSARDGREIATFRNARFSRALFAGSANFSQVVFSGYATFDDVIFARMARFEGATFLREGWFLRAVFLGDARFFDAAFHDGDFESAVVSGRADFQNTTFAGGSARFMNVTFVGSAQFNRALFCGDAVFVNAAFADSLELAEAVFLWDARFSGRPIDLVRSPSTQEIRLGPTAPSGVKRGVLTSEGGATERARRSVRSVIADGALFAADLNFSNRDILADSRFNGTRFQGVTTFHGSTLHQGVSFHRATFSDALSVGLDLEIPANDLKRLYTAMTGNFRAGGINDASYQSWLENWQAEQRRNWTDQRRKSFGVWTDDSGPISPMASTKRNDRYQRLEHAFRTLKQAMELARHRPDEAMFFRLELQARRQRSDIDSWERVASAAYGEISDYGGSVGTPLAWLAFLIVLVAGIVWFPAEVACQGAKPNTGLEQTCPKAGSPTASAIDLGFEALMFSAGNALPIPTAMTSTANPKAKTMVTILGAHSPAGWRAALFVLSTLESVASVALLFLTGLALRRRFQIN